MPMGDAPSRAAYHDLRGVAGVADAEVVLDELAAVEADNSSGDER